MSLFGGHKHKNFLRAILEGVAKRTVLTVNNILDVYRGNPSYYYSVYYGTSVTSARDDLLEREPPPVPFQFFLKVTEDNLLKLKNSLFCVYN